MSTFNTSEHLGPWVGKLQKLTSIYMAQMFKKHQIDLTRLQWILLQKLIEDGGISQNDLALLTNRNKASLTRLINTLEKKQMVSRIPSKSDGRCNLIHLTQNGRNVLESSYPVMNEMIQTLQGGIDKSELESAAVTIRKIINNIAQNTDIKMSH